MKKTDLPCCNNDCSQGKFCLQRMRTIPPDDQEYAAWSINWLDLLGAIFLVALCAVAVGYLSA